MSKRISEMNYEEKYEKFKEGVIEMVKENFNGEMHDIEPIVFLGVKQEVLSFLIKENMKNDCDCEKCKANRKLAESINPDEINESIHIIPIFISNELAAGSKLSETFGEMAINHAKEMVNKKVHGVIEELNKVIFNGVQYSAHVAEAYLVEHKFTEKDQSLQNMGKPSSLDDIEKEIVENGGVRNHPNAKEKAIIVLETMHFSEVVTFDMLRSKEANYQELTNQRCDSTATEPQTGGYLTRLVHKSKITN